MVEQQGAVASPPRRGANLVRMVNDYIALTKPPIISLLVITAIGSMFVAAKGVPSPLTMLLVCVGGSLGAGGANALNHFMDQDIDILMTRTRERPVPGRRISPANALGFGIILNILAFSMLAAWVNVLAASLTMAASLFYVLVYTGWLKRTTPHNIVIGGAAGAIPPMVGWAAITGGLDLPALYMFTIVFFWTPPHFWALALLIETDYERAGIPMLPVVAGRENTVGNIFLYSIVLIALSLVFAATSAVGWVYLGSASVLGSVFLLLAWRLKSDSTASNARKLYLYSLLYLALLFVAMLADSLTASWL